MAHCRLFALLRRRRLHYCVWTSAVAAEPGHANPLELSRAFHPVVRSSTAPPTLELVPGYSVPAALMRRSATSRGA